MDNQILPRKAYLGRAINHLERALCLINEMRGRRIPVTVKNEQDYEFVFVNVGNGKKQMAVF